jgi:hypothetical protein
MQDFPLSIGVVSLFGYGLRWKLGVGGLFVSQKRCFECGQLWCLDCGAFFKDAQSIEHDCPAWEGMVCDDDDLDETD